MAIADLISHGDLAINDGYRAKNSELSTHGLPFARAQNINDGFKFGEPDRFPEENLSRVAGKVSLPGDVVFTSKGTVGRFALVRDKTPRFVYSPQLCYWRSLNRERIDPRWLFYWMQSREFRVQYSGVAGQTDMADYVSLTDQRRMHITLPSLAQQRAIAHILGTLDDKIELNRRMNETLEAIARALFKSWFVDFDPVRAKAEGRDPGLSAYLADLFPDSFEDSELGEVPEGWKVSPLPDVIEVNPTRSLRRGEIAPYLDMANMPTHGHSPDAVIEREFGSGMRFTNGDTLVARITPCLENGKTAYVDFLQDGQVGWGSTEYIVLRPKPPLPEEFAYCLARSNEFRDFAIQSMTGSSGRQRVPAESLSHYRVASAPEPVADQFGTLVRPLLARASAAAVQSRTLATLRDTMLPKLISGELRIKNGATAI
ncbi:MAG: restriction endonuclease subunit S [Chloroflexi bacterium]|nr:restriction endonuclease subunit S [Chloroflexota bacterium]